MASTSSPSSPAPVRACLFDMDGLLINSEDLISSCINEILHEYNQPPIPWHVKAQLQGRPLSEASQIFLSWAKLPLTVEEYQQKLRGLHLKRFPMTKVLPGVESLLQNLHSIHDIELALATSSTRDKFELKTNHLQDLFAVFPKESRVLGDDARIPAGKHKPAPDIYLLALQCINDRRERQKKDGDQSTPIKAEECLVFEDAIQGVESAKAAGMQVVWCPHQDLLKECQKPDSTLLKGTVLEGIDLNPETAKDDSKDGKTTTTADNSIRLVKSLKDFPYESYGISLPN